jgi:hypothetical protein
LQQLWSRVTRPFVATADRQAGAARVAELRARTSARPAVHRPAAGTPRPSSSSSPAARPAPARPGTAPPAAARPAPPPRPANPLATAGQWISDRGRDVDGVVRNTTSTVERGLSTARHAAGDAAHALIHAAASPLASHPATRPLAANIVRQADQAVNTAVTAGDATTHFVGGAVHGLSGIVSGPIGLVGSGLQLADPRVRADAQRNLDTLRAHPLGAAVAVRDAAVRSFTHDPAGTFGEVVGNLVPVGAVANGLGKVGKVGKLAELANDASRAVDVAADANRALKAADGASETARAATGAARVTASTTAARPAVLPLLSTEEYRALVTRQAQEGRVSLDGIARPGIAKFGDDGIAEILQGAGRYEKARAGDMLDMFVPRGSPLPKGAVLVDAEVPTDSVRLANVLSSRGAAGANPDWVDFTTSDFATGKPFDYQRILLPMEQARAGTSTIGHLVKVAEGKLAERLGSPEAAAAALAQRPGWNGGSLVDKFEILKELGVAHASDLE